MRLFYLIHNDSVFCSCNKSVFIVRVYIHASLALNLWYLLQELAPLLALTFDCCRNVSYFCCCCCVVSYVFDELLQLENVPTTQLTLFTAITTVALCDVASIK